MENAIVNTRKDSRKDENSLCLTKNMKSVKDDSVSKRLVGKVRPEHVLFLDSRTPRQIISFDEQYLRRCLEFIQIRALDSASCNIPSYKGNLAHNLSSREIRSTCNLNGIVIECPSMAGTKNIVISSAKDLILGAITRSKSMINIIKSPFLPQLDTIGSSFVSSPGELNSFSPQKIQKEPMLLKDYIFGPEPVHKHKRLNSISSTNSTCSDQSSSSGLTKFSQGMLHCTWNNGFPHYVFSVDDKREIYIANMMKVDSPDKKVFNYMYTFHSREDLVGKMKVSTLFTLLPDNSEIMETQFVLFGLSEGSLGEIQTRSHALQKKNGFPNKVKDVFKASRTFKQRNSSKLCCSSVVLEQSPRDSSQVSLNNLDQKFRVIPTDEHLPANLELAAIIVKDHVRHNNKEADIGGWGLKFLKKDKQRNKFVRTEVPSQSCLHDNGDCSTSMNILIPEDFHGGPRTRNGGPSSLIERWRSGGHCDCGGWDFGCPITVLNPRPSRTYVLSQADMPLDCKTFDVFVEGSKQDEPTMKMVNIHDGLYYISFQTTLSAMQSFSIAAAIIHTHSQTLRHKLYMSK